MIELIGLIAFVAATAWIVESAHRRNCLKDNHRFYGEKCVHCKVDYTKPSRLGIAKQKISALQLENQALQECIGNYEVAIREVQSDNKTTEKLLRSSQRKLARLVNLVKHNARNADTILKQLGE